ncbi:ABC transporter permease [Nonomuraea purpurea]|uniref:ABC transporter permease n=1 Tax=Nonomuraea purpurea TaxID=1849276 RepID=A0ABV8GG60_9ACTN
MTGWASRAANRTVVGLVLLFLWTPIVVVFIVSFDTSTFLRFPPREFSFAPYVEVFQTAEFSRGLWISLVVAAGSTLLAVTVSTAAALALHRHRFRGSGIVQGFFVSPLLVPHIVLALALLLLFSPLGLTDGYTGLILAHLVLCIPYAIRTISVSLSTADTACEDAARVLGANGWATFRRVTFPLIRPGVVAGAVMSFLVSFDEAVISLFLSGYYVKPLPVALLEHVETQAGPEVAALSVLLILFSIAIMLLLERMTGLRRSLR